MIAISFFSYKGGVGRTMAITNIATRLAEFGKSVLILDFDLEAPGVPFKLKDYLAGIDIKKGVVDYIYNFSSTGKIDDLDDYVITLPQSNPEDAKLWLLPAGNSDMDAYWRNLSKINWHDLFYKEGGKGLRFFLDLKQKIKKQFNPDYLLIDSRTGITELSGISLKILADEAVLLFVNNQENEIGTEKVLRFLTNNEDLTKRTPKVHLVLTRIENPEGNRSKFNKEYKLLESMKKRFSRVLGESVDINVIHSDNSLQMDEALAFSKKDEGIHSEHMNLFERIFKDKFSAQEWANKENKAKAERIYRKALTASSAIEKTTLLKQAIDLDPKKWEYLYTRGWTFLQNQEFDKAEKDLISALKISPSLSVKHLLVTCYYNNGKLEQAKALTDELLITDSDNEDLYILNSLILRDQNKREEALEFLNKGILLFPAYPPLLNIRADLYRRLGKYEEAIIDISKAIEEEQSPIYLGTLAEIYCAQNRMEEFYLTLSTALSNGLRIIEMRTARDAYEKVRTDKRFIEVLRSFNMNSEDIYHTGPILDSNSDS